MAEEEQNATPPPPPPAPSSTPPQPQQLNFDDTDNQEKEEEQEVNEVQGLEENFFYNSMLARALIHILPHRDRKSVRLWLNKLADMDNTDEEVTLRHEYMWFLLLMLETKKIREPFDAMPPKDLVPLKDSVPRNVYEEVLLFSDQASIPVEATAGAAVMSESMSHSSGKMSSPAKFLQSQPWPKEGVICYLAAFSDRDF